jgi:hypothetical protein
MRTAEEIENEISQAEENLSQATAEAKRQLDLAAGLQADVATLKSELVESNRERETKREEMRAFCATQGIEFRPEIYNF